MKADVRKILDDALKLPPELRANLADLLLEPADFLEDSLRWAAAVKAVDRSPPAASGA